MCLDWETFGFLNLLCHLTISLDSTSLVWKICSRLEIILSRWNMVDRNLVSSVGEYGAIQKESGSSDKNPQMSKVFPFFHLILNL
jgi:hypothetical protein